MAEFSGREDVIESVAKAMYSAAWVRPTWEGSGESEREKWRRRASIPVDAVWLAVVRVVADQIAAMIEAELRETVRPEHPDWCQGYGVGMSAAVTSIREYAASVAVSSSLGEQK